LRSLAYILIAFAIFTFIVWASVYSRDNSVFTARGSTPFDYMTQVELTLWLLEGQATITLYVPECVKVTLLAYSRGGGLIVYRAEGLEGPLRYTETIGIPHPGYYNFRVQPTLVEGCERPIANGALNVYQYAQPERMARTILIALTAITAIAGFSVAVWDLIAPKERKSIQ